jgi:hypothetical protein
MFFREAFISSLPQFVRHGDHIFQPSICGMNTPMSVSSLRYAQLGDMKEPGLDGRHRDKNPGKASVVAAPEPATSYPRVGDAPPAARSAQ